MFDRFPAETHAYRQWLVWRYEKREGAKDTKVPYNVHTRRMASVTNPAHWCDYDAAMQAVQEAGPNLSGMGFVLTDNDPFAVIDLDDTHGDVPARQRQEKVYHEFNSYSELSPSGNGLHIWVKGQVPHGRKRSFIEVYSNERYMTVTGNVVKKAPDLRPNSPPDPVGTVIADRNEMLNVLWSQMGGPPATYVYGEQQEQKHTDEEILEFASKAANGDKFMKLWAGQWQNDPAYAAEGQSGADQALMNILAFYTQNRAQLMRLFRMSALGERDKAQRDRYLDYTINRAFDRQLPPLDLEGLLIAFKSMVAVNKAEGKPSEVYVNGELVDGMGAGKPGGTPAPADHSGHASEAAAGVGMAAVASQGHSSPYSPSDASQFPPGMLGEVAQFLYDQAPRPVYEIALAGAIGFMAGITGRSYNVSGTGLNQYVLSLAPTGSGKEAIAGGTDKLIEAIKAQVPMASDFVGPGEIVSSAGLIKWLAAKSCVYTLVGEFGLKLAEMSSPKANPHLSSVKRVLTDLYHKSGAGAMLQPIAYSDKDKNTPAIASPSLTIIGESVPGRFYEVLSEDMIADGLLPRFTIIEYNGKRPPRNERASSVRPRIDLVERLGSLMAQCLQLAHNRQVHNVNMTPEAKDTFDLFDKWCDTCMNEEGASEVNSQLWNRAHLKAMKLAALVAVGINYLNPVIDENCARWATDMVAKSTNRLLAKFMAGEVGDGAGNESRQAREVIKLITAYLTEPPEKFASYGVDIEMHRAGVIPYPLIQRKLVAMAMFRHDRIGATNAIKRALDLLLTADELREVPPLQMQSQFGRKPRAFMVADPARFLPRSGV